VYSKDKIPNKNGFFVINMQNSKAGHGTHWVAMVKLPNNNYYFDSYGIIPPTEIEKALDNKYIYSTIDLQALKSKACGYFCIEFLEHMQNKSNNMKANYEQFIHAFKNNPSKNDTMLSGMLCCGK